MNGWTDRLTDGCMDRKMDEQIYSWVDILSLDRYPACKTQQMMNLAQDGFGLCSFCQ